jgi:sec-independent protein translocase protein TatA
MPLNIHPAFLIVLLVIVLIIFGPGKLPELGAAVGRMTREFRKASSEVKEDLKASAAEGDAGRQESKQISSAPASASRPKADSERSG